MFHTSVPPQLAGQGNRQVQMPIIYKSVGLGVGWFCMAHSTFWFTGQLEWLQLFPAHY